MKNVLEWLEAAAGACPGKLAVADEGTELSFAELQAKAQAVGSALAPLAGAGKAVAIYAEKGADVLAAMFGIVYAGGFYSLIDTRQTKPRVESILAALAPAADASFRRRRMASSSENMPRGISTAMCPCAAQAASV